MKPFIQPLLSTVFSTATGTSRTRAVRLRLLLVCLLLCSSIPLFGEGPQRILFLGNSYTSVNDLPQVFAEVLRSAKITVPNIKSVTPGGKTLMDHATSLPKSIEAIDEGGWDVIVLQGQSQEAAFSQNNTSIRAKFLEGAKSLCERIRKTSPQARIIFYQTWARHPNFWTSGTDHAASYGKDPTEMQARIRLWYGKAAAANKAEVAPVGEAWERNYQSTEPLQLHTSDHSHPQFGGTYLAALVLYRTIYKPKDVAVPYIGKLGTAEARILQRLAE